MTPGPPPGSVGSSSWAASSCSARKAAPSCSAPGCWAWPKFPAQLHSPLGLFGNWPPALGSHSVLGSWLSHWALCIQPAIGSSSSSFSSFSLECHLPSPLPWQGRTWFLQTQVSQQVPGAQGTCQGWGYPPHVASSRQVLLCALKSHKLSNLPISRPPHHAWKPS